MVAPERQGCGGVGGKDFFAREPCPAMASLHLLNKLSGYPERKLLGQSGVGRQSARGFLAALPRKPDLSSQMKAGHLGVWGCRGSIWTPSKVVFFHPGVGVRVPGGRPSTRH